MKFQLHSVCTGALCSVAQSVTSHPTSGGWADMDEWSLCRASSHRERVIAIVPPGYWQEKCTGWDGASLDLTVGRGAQTEAFSYLSHLCNWFLNHNQARVSRSRV